MIKNKIKKAYQYVLSHLWCSLLLIFFLLCGSIIIIMQIYLKNEYVDYLKEETYTTQKTILESVNENTEFLLDEFITYGIEFATDEELYDCVNRYVENPDGAVEQNNLLYILAKDTRRSKWIENVCIASGSGVVNQFDRQDGYRSHIWNKATEKYLIELNGTIKDNIKNGIKPQYVGLTYPLSYPDDLDKDLLHIGFPLKGHSGSNKVKYSLVISMDAEFLNQSLNLIGGEKMGEVTTGYISDSEGTIIYHMNKAYIGTSQEQYLSEGEYVHYSEPISGIGWYLNIAIDERLLLERVNEIYGSGVFLYAVALLGVAISFLIFINWMLKPVRCIKASMKKAKIGNYRGYINVKGSHEIWEMAEEYNTTLKAIERMNKQLEQSHEEKIISLKKQRDAERNALESQINAHFICNTIGVINYEAIEAGNHTVSIMLKKLSNILRYTFDQKHQNVYMFQEIAWIEQYLYLQKSRYVEAFNYKIDFPDNLGAWPCRKLMLQPFVENSIIHGFEGFESGGLIRITGSEEAGYLRLVIEDNGSGMDEEIRECIQQVIDNPIMIKKEQIGIGISNVLARMKLYYGDNLKVEMESAKGIGTRFTFYIPNPAC
ncbi:cache domain-containing sensor histidine kinase [Anaerobium acetethylicum]|uniref:histidine kinase n=1 Tax=Anaerobium acetethylicum TaxID=1619234 RepID=A0A1D3TW13_9FIRM|nr:sensor histidine kinase [Anaerobium acetethylicum]SCP98382.1 Histidine kinase-, DNA gyrase B-, and HSP90-like ATPase [Anaerobium acetethylicum]